MVENEEEYTFVHPRVKLGLAGVYSTGLIEDNNGDEISSAMAGIRGNIEMKIIPSLFIGAEGTYMSAVDQKTRLIHSIKRDSALLVLRGVITPNTSSQIYFLTGIGQAVYRASFKMPIDTLKHRSTVLMGGIGVSVPFVWRLYLAGEYRLTYDMSVWENFILCGPKAREEYSLSVSCAF